MAKKIVNPFGIAGDRVAVPDATQSDGSVSYSEGYTFDYQRPVASGPLVKNIERQKMNQLFFDITDNIKFWQDFAYPQWYSSVAGYPRLSRVYHDDFYYQSAVPDNTATPGSGPEWIELGMLVTSDTSGGVSISGILKSKNLLQFLVTTNDATPSRLSFDGLSAAAGNQVILLDSSAAVFNGELIARSASGNVSAWKFEGAIKRGAGVATTVLVAAVVPALVAQDVAAATWSVSVTADTTLGGINLSVTGVAATTIQWHASMQVTTVPL